MAESKISDQLLETAPLARKALGNIAVRPVLLHRLWKGGSFGEYTPTRKAWEEGWVGAAASALSQLVGNEVSVRVHAASDNSIPRRVFMSGKWSDLMYLKQEPTPEPLIHAEVTGVMLIDIGKNRTLPVLRLVDVNQIQSKLPGSGFPEYGLTVPDLAHAVQDHTMYLTSVQKHGRQ